MSDFFSEFKRKALAHPTLSAVQERSLLYKVQQGDTKAREKLIEHNYRLVESCVSRWRGLPIPAEDAFQAGVEALIAAIDSFDLSFNTRLSTHAYRRIEAALKAAATTQSHMIQPPRDVVRANLEIKRVADQLAAKNGYTPSAEEVAEALDETVEWVREHSELPSVLSLDAMMASYEDDDGVLRDGSDWLDENSPDPAQVFEDSSTHVEETIKKICTPREARVLDLRLGLNGEYEHTLDETAKIMDLSKITVRRAEATAHAKLKAAAREWTDRTDLHNTTEEER